MAVFAFVHGAGDVGWYWHLVEGELRRRGHQTVAPDLPCDDDDAGLAEYADVVVEAIGAARDLVVVGQSFGGFTVPLVAARVPTEMIVLVAGMVPVPGERASDWFAATGLDAAVREQARRDGGLTGHTDPLIVFYHDLPPALAAEALRRGRRQSDTPGDQPWPLDAWPDVPTRFVRPTEDRFFPPAFLGRVAAERLGIEPDDIRAGHCAALSRPAELAEMLTGFLADVPGRSATPG